MSMFDAIKDAVDAANTGDDAVDDLHIGYLDAQYANVPGVLVSVDMGETTVTQELGRDSSYYEGLPRIEAVGSDMDSARKVMDIVLAGTKDLVAPHPQHRVTIVRFDLANKVESYEADQEVCIVAARFAAFWVESQGA